MYLGSFEQFISLDFVSGKDSLPVDLPKPVENEKHGEVEHANVNPLSVHPLPLVSLFVMPLKACLQWQGWPCFMKKPFAADQDF